MLKVKYKYLNVIWHSIDISMCYSIVQISQCAILHFYYLKRIKYHKAILYSQLSNAINISNIEQTAFLRLEIIVLVFKKDYPTINGKVFNI